jgi:integrase
MAKGKFGTIEKLPSGRWRAKYTHRGRRYSGPTSFLASADASAWLAGQQVKINSGQWKSPERVAADARQAAVKITFSQYAKRWLDKRRTRRGELSPRTREDYHRIIEQYLLPTLGRMPVSSIGAEDVRAWYDRLDKATPTQRAHNYSLLATIMASAVGDGITDSSPCVIPGAGSVERASHEVIPVRLDELTTLVDAMPSRLKVMVLLGTWTTLRFGELTELRRGDVDLSGEVIRIRRAVVRIKKGFETKTPKSRAGVRDVSIPPHIIEPLRRHMAEHVGTAYDALLFPAAHGGHLALSTWNRHWYKAREAAGRPDLRLHDLRHSGLTWLAQSGATTRELMDIAGHSSPAAALRYQHVADGRKRELAARLSKLVAEG